MQSDEPWTENMFLEVFKDLWKNFIGLNDKIICQAWLKTEGDLPTR